MKRYSRISLPFLATVLLLILFINRLQASGAAPSGLTVTSPTTSDVMLAELDEYASFVLGDPWDMKEATDLSYYRQNDSALADSAFANGLYSAKMTQGNGMERITLLTAGAISNTALRTGKIGYNYPINANHYRYLAFRMYHGNSDYNSGLIQWYAEDTYTTAVMGLSNTFLVGPNAGWQTYVIDLATIGLLQGSQNWNGTIRELILHPYAGAGAASSTVKLDWARLTHEDPRTARPFTIQWSGNNGAPVSVYASKGNKTLESDDLLIAASQTGSSFTWQTGTVEAGKYYIAVTNGQETAWSAGAVNLHAPAQLTITKPSMTSGADYAETELGNAWDMQDPEDINNNTPSWWASGVTNESFVGDVYRSDLITCASTHIDPKLFIGHLDRPGEPDPTIDTSKYRYLSFRFKHSGTQNVTEGWVARLGWWQQNGSQVPEEVVMSRDIILLEGWQTYSVDLWQPDVVDEAHPIQRSWLNSAPNRLRFDPSELNRDLLPAYIEIDWLKITAVDEVSRGDIFPIQFDVQSDLPVDLTIYYDTDANPSNGRSLITNVDQITAPADASSAVLAEPSALTANYSIYLPALYNRFVSDCSADSCYAWNTSGVQPGLYTICIQVDDGYNSAYQCSEAPVKIK